MPGPGSFLSTRQEIRLRTMAQAASESAEQAKHTEFCVRVGVRVRVRVSIRGAPERRVGSLR